ncbi:MAG: GDSL-type esterase/lipase family protein [Candidatus Thorarchaeota archaeon]|jgi:lysophospholipase L1-like esterase
MDVSLITIVAFVIVAIVALLMRYRARINRDDATVWERSVRKYEKHDRADPPATHSIVFTGSSSIVYWKTLKADMDPLPVLHRGFGGSRILDVIHYANRIVLPYEPRGIVFYAGENDISGILFTKKKTADEVRNAYQSFCEKIHATQPDVPIYFISIKPPKRRKKLWPEMKRANELIEEFCKSDERLHYIDIVQAMLDEEGNARANLFKWDGIHMNEEGYEIWNAIAKPILLEAFLR